MRPENRDPELLWDMLAHAREASELAHGMSFEAYMSDARSRRAIERVVQIIGEAASKVSREYRDTHPEVPWIPVIKQRHILVHDYGQILDERIWRVATVHVPVLITVLESLVPNPSDDGAPGTSTKKPQ